MKRIIILIMTLTTLLMTGCKSENGDTTQVIVTDTVPSLVIQIQKCARLYTTEYHIHKIVTHNDILKLKGNILRKDIDIKLPLGERKIAFPMDATLKAYIDFSDDKFENQSQRGEGIRRADALVFYRQRTVVVRTTRSSGHSEQCVATGHQADGTGKCRARTGADAEGNGLQRGEHHHCFPQESGHYETHQL